MIPGPTVVVSPLIALQQALEANDLGQIAVINSLQSKADRRRAFD